MGAEQRAQWRSGNAASVAELREASLYVGRFSVQWARRLVAARLLEPGAAICTAKTAVGNCSSDTSSAVDAATAPAASCRPCMPKYERSQRPLSFYSYTCQPLLNRPAQLQPNHRGFAETNGIAPDPIDNYESIDPSTQLSRYTHSISGSTTPRLRDTSEDEASAASDTIIQNSRKRLQCIEGARPGLVHATNAHHSERILHTDVAATKLDKLAAHSTSTLGDLSKALSTCDTDTAFPSRTALANANGPTFVNISSSVQIPLRPLFLGELSLPTRPQHSHCAAGDALDFAFGDTVMQLLRPVPCTDDLIVEPSSLSLRNAIWRRSLACRIATIIIREIVSSKLEPLAEWHEKTYRSRHRSRRGEIQPRDQRLAHTTPRTTAAIASLGGADIICEPTDKADDRIGAEPCLQCDELLLPLTPP